MNGGPPHAQLPQNAPQAPPQERPVKPSDDAELLPHIDIKEEGEVLLDQVNGQIELLESQEPLAGTSESGTHMPEDGQDWLQEGDHELKRVKVRPAGFHPSQCVDHVREAIGAAHVPHSCVDKLNFRHHRSMNS